MRNAKNWSNQTEKDEFIVDLTRRVRAGERCTDLARELGVGAKRLQTLRYQNDGAEIHIARRACEEAA